MPQNKAAFESDLLTTADAAQILSLSADMVRLLARDGRLPTAAETVRGVRLFRRRDVDALASDRAGHRAHAHIVQFYEGIDFLSTVAADFIRQGLRAHVPVMVFVARDRQQALLDRLAASGFDPRGAQAAGRLSLFDARETLERFMDDRLPHAQRFRDHFEGLVDGFDGERGRIRIYGETVDLLCRVGLVEAALRFEELWNDLARGRGLTRLCGYSMEHFPTGDDVGRFERICELHTSVVPTERYVQASDAQERLRKVALLEQRARALETELERHRAERQLPAGAMR
jgi:hypothetical protein